MNENEGTIGSVTPPSLHRKLAEVAATIGHIPKRGRNEYLKYDYAMEADIVDAVRGGLAERHVMLLPQILDVQREGTLTTLIMRYTFVDGDSGETFSCQWAGTGDDKGDKGAYKAITGATKYFLLKTFLMPTGDDPEADAETDKRAAKSGTPPATFKSAKERDEWWGSRPKAGNGADAALQKAGWEPVKPDDIAAERKRAMAMFAEYGFTPGNDGRNDRLAFYSKALGRQVTHAEAKGFTAATWREIATALKAAYEPPDEARP